MLDAIAASHDDLFVFLFLRGSELIIIAIIITIEIIIVICELFINIFTLCIRRLR